MGTSPNPLRVAMDVTPLCNPIQGGVARYTYQLAKAMGVLLEEHGGRLDLLCRRSRYRRRAMIPEIPGSRLRWIEKSWWPFYKGVDLVHGTDVRVPNWKSVAQVSTLHDVFAHVSPEFSDSDFRIKRHAVYAEVASHCSRMIAVSQRTKADLLRHLDFEEERVDVVHEGVDERFQPASEGAIGEVQLQLGVKRPYMLYLGELSARKNLVRLVQAFSAGGFHKTHQLVLAGKPSFRSECIVEEVHRLRLSEKVLWTGFVDDRHLPALYTGADVFCFPTLYEGFGLPVLEAMACGTPVVGGSVGAVPEVAGGHAELANPLDVDSIAYSVSRAMDYSQEQRGQAKAHAATFSWERTARETLLSYHRALPKPVLLGAESSHGNVDRQQAQGR